MKERQKIRLLALNLAIVLICSMLVMPVSAYPWQKIRLGYGDEDMRGQGWEYDSLERTLTLENNDVGSITVTGDLEVISRGNVSVSGGLLVYDGSLTLLNDGNLEITGGLHRNYSDGKLYGGEGICAGGGIDILLLQGTMTVQGGWSPDALGGDGILSYGGSAVRILTVPLDFDSDVYEGMAYPDAKIEVWGGDGVVGGNAIHAGGFQLDANARIVGGSAQQNGQYAGRAVSLPLRTYGENFVCGSHWPQSAHYPPPSSYTAFTATLKAGSTDIAAIGTEGTLSSESEYGWEHFEKYLSRDSSPHVGYACSGWDWYFGETEWSEGEEGVYATPYSLRIYPKNYRAVIDGSGGAVNGRPSQAVSGEYPTKIDLSRYDCSKPGSTLIGFEINGKTVAANESFIPTEDVTVKALWKEEPVRIQVNASPSEGGTVSGGGDYPVGASASITAVPKDGYSFVEWQLNGQRVSDSANYTFTVHENQTYTAVFEKQPDTMHCKVTVEALFSPYSPAGETVTLHVTVDDGYQLNRIQAFGPEGQTVALSGSGNTYTFPMPAFDVSVYVDCVEI